MNPLLVPIWRLLMPLHDFVCSHCKNAFEEMVSVGEIEVPCPRCPESADRVYIACAKQLTTIVPDYPGCKKKRAGYIHTHGDKPTTGVQGRGAPFPTSETT